MRKSNPIVRVGDVLVVAMQGELSELTVREIREDLGRRIATYAVRGVVLELSGLDTLDANAARGVRDVCQTARFMGVETVIAGLDPKIADALVEKGVSFEGCATALDRESAMARLVRPTAPRSLNRSGP